MTAGMHDVTPEDVIRFWRTAGPDKWFKKDPAFDAEITARFLPVYEAAAAGRLAGWEATPDGALALVIVLDQFPRNMFRGQARIYAADPLARAVADRAITRNFDQRARRSMCQFFYLPFMHSEELKDQERCLALSHRLGDEEFDKYAKQHAEIVRRFGRFPHRNAILSRATTPDEQVFLDAGGFAG